jgi:hypothetical protein
MNESGDLLAPLAVKYSEKTAATSQKTEKDIGFEWADRKADKLFIMLNKN